MMFSIALASCGGGGGGTAAPGGTTTPSTYNISGTISGAVVQGVTLTLTGGATTITASNGSYSFTGLANGSHTVTPSLTGYTFNPASSTINVSGANVSGTDFTATINATPTYAVSGTVTGAVLQNVLITLSGAGSATILTDASGNYSFTGLANGSYTATPSLAGYSFNPVTAGVNVSGANTTVGNFVSTAATVTPTLALFAGGSITGTAARLREPRAVATDSSGNVYAADWLNPSISKITPAGVVTTLAGPDNAICVANPQGQNLTCPDGFLDGTGTAARFFQPEGIATDTIGNVYVADTGNSTIRKITPSGVVTTLAGPDNATCAVPSCASCGASCPRGWVDGTGSAARFNRPTGIATDAAGNVYVADTWNQKIRKITSAGVVTTLAGPVCPQYGSCPSGAIDGTGSAARFNVPHGIATDATGNVYVADWFNHTIRKVTPAGVVTTLAGIAGIGGASIDGMGTAAQFTNPYGIAIDSAGNIYVSQGGNALLRKITPAGMVTSIIGCPDYVNCSPVVPMVPGPTYSAGLYGLAISGTFLYIAGGGSGAVLVVNPLP